MVYVHIDDYVNDSWGKSFVNVLEKENVEHKNIDLLSFSSFSNVEERSTLAARLGHDQKEKKQLKPKLPKIYNTWENIFPSKSAYKFYDNKWREYKFLRENNLSVVKTEYIENRSELISFLVENKIDFPVVVKKKEGAGSNKVWLKHALSNLSSDLFPLLVQPYIPSNFDLRIFYLNDKVFGFKRKHKKGPNFPYGGNWYEGEAEKIDVLDYVSEEFIKKVHNTFRNNIPSPTMSFDLIFDKDNSPKILEFSYCFAKNQVLECNSYYQLPTMKKNTYFKDGRFGDLDFFKNLVAYETLKWLDVL